MLTAAWGVVTTIVLLFAIEKTIGIRLTPEEEKEGCDLVEHGIGEDSDNEEVETDAHGKKWRAFFARKGPADVERFRDDDEQEKEAKFTRAFAIRLPTFAQNLRCKHTKKQRNNKDGSNDSVSTEVDAAENDQTQRESDDTRRSRGTGTFFMKLPIIARNLRRKHENKRRTSEEPSTANISTTVDTQGKDGDPRTSDNASRPRSIQEIRSGNKDSQGSNDLRSMYSVESDIEDFIRREVKTTSETCYSMAEQKRTADKCVQVIYEQGVLIEL